MKKYILPLLALLAMPVVLTACSDDDDNNTKSVAPIESGAIPAKNVFVFIDDKYTAHPAEMTASVEGSFNPATQTSASLTLRTSAIFYVRGGEGGLSSNSPAIPINITKKDGEVTFSGSVIEGGHTFDVTGEVKANYAGENDWIIRVKDSYTPERTPLVGKSLEIAFEAGEMYPYGYDFSYPELISLAHAFFNRLPETIVENSGYSAVRVTFVDETTYELEFKDAESGEYVKDETTHRYMARYASSNVSGDPIALGTVISFIDEPSFKAAQAANFNLKPIDILAENKENNFAQQTMPCYMANPQLMCVTTMIVGRAHDTTDGLALYWMAKERNFSENGFMSQWTALESVTNQAERDFVALQDAEKEGKFAFSAWVKIKVTE